MLLKDKIYRPNKKMSHLAKDCQTLTKRLVRHLQHVVPKQE